MLSKTTQQHYLTVADRCAERAQAGSCPVIGISGAQGSGKSTLAQFLVSALADRGLRCVSLSIDDFYLSRARRQQLAETVHPLLLTRGVPGTHSVQQGIDLIARLRSLGGGESQRLPAFSKADDDVLTETEWPRVTGPIDLIIFEGWCLGLPPEAAESLATPVNALERLDDPDAAWRGYVNDQLAGDYARWFACLDALIFLQVPGFEQVLAWRQQQERETAREKGQGKGLMSATELPRFIQHYERLTRHALRVLPSSADICISIDVDHSVTSVASHV